MCRIYLRLLRSGRFAPYIFIYALTLICEPQFFMFFVFNHSFYQFWQAHQRLKITKDHTIKAKEEAESEAQSSTTTSTKIIYCSLHPQEQLSLFCEICDKLTCRDCQLSGHRDHRYKFIHEIASETRSVITGRKIIFFLTKHLRKLISTQQTINLDCRIAQRGFV